MEAVFDAEIIAGISAGVAGIEKHVKHGKPKPVYKPIGGSINMAAATGQLVLPDSPARGRIWNVLKVIVAGADGHTALAGVIVDVYAGTALDPNSPPALDTLILSGGTGNVPSITWYSKEVEWVASGFQIIANIYGATIGQNINVVARVAEYESKDVEACRV